MRLIGLLCWYDEQPAWLAEVIASLAAGGIDHLVAVDGAYALYPEAEGCSPSEQAHTVISACAGARIGCTLHQPQNPWVDNEVEKRSFMFAAGHLVATPGEDWLIVADADEVWTHTLGLRQALETTPHDVAEVSLYETGQYMIRKCFRAHPRGITVRDYHARYVDGDGRFLWDAARTGVEVEAEGLQGIRVRHRPGERLCQRTEFRNEYYAIRGELGVESAA